MTACMHICIYITNKIAGSTSRVEESSMLISATGAGGRSLQHPVWKKYEISLQKSMEFLFQSHLKLTSAEKDYIISQVATSLWSGGNNSMPGKQLNPQNPAPQQQ